MSCYLDVFVCLSLQNCNVFDVNVYLVQIGYSYIYIIVFLRIFSYGYFFCYLLFYFGSMFFIYWWLQKYGINIMSL